jgi:hypothetical protein
MAAAIVTRLSATGRKPSVILILFGTVLLTLMVLLIWVNRWSEHRESYLTQLVYERKTKLPSAELRKCFDKFYVDGLALNGRWRRNLGHKDRIEALNEARHLKVSITDEGSFRAIEVETRSGRPLRSGEQNQIRNCSGAS